jgi:hypothetical protein
MAGMPVSVTGPGTATGSGVTNAQGKWTYSYISQGSGRMPIVANAGGANLELGIQVNAKVADVPAAVKFLSATMTVDPIVVLVNGNPAEIRLLFRGEKNAPIENVRARVGLSANLSSTDGVFSVGAGEPIVYSDKNGVATLSFIPGTRFSPNEQVKIYACYGRKDDLGKTSEGCTNGFAISPAQITVVESPVSISIGRDDKVALGDTGLTYIEKFTILVVDSAGNPKADVQVTPVIDLLAYGKGAYDWDPVAKKWYLKTFLECPAEDQMNPDGIRNGTIEGNEDVNRNGVLDAGEDVNGNGVLDFGEDLNNNAQLDPRQSDVSIALVGSTKTDKNGLATLRIEFPKDKATWVRYTIRVSAPGVLSPPAWHGKYQPSWVSPPLEAIKNEGTPAFVASPYGTVLNCASPL